MGRVTRPLVWGVVLVAGLLAAVAVAPPASLHGQDKSKSAKRPKGGGNKPQANTKSLDIQADKLQSSFAHDAEELAGQYYKAGHFEKAKALLESVLAVFPDSPTARKKLDLIQEGILNSNDVNVEVNASHGWKQTGAMVVENRPLRIKAEGSYRFEATAGGLTAAGFPTKDPGEDMVAGVPCGGLMGIILSENKSGKPFFIGESLDFTPKENGMLLLRLNTPPGNKCSGKIRVSISGYVQPAN